MSSLRLDWCSYEAARFAVEHWHYSRTMPKSKLAKIGVWEDGRFVGCVVYGVGATSRLVKSYGLKMEQGCELARVALSNNHTSQVSRIVSISLKLLRTAYPGLQIVVSFADPAYGHHGGIYQAGGWVYTGRSVASDEYLYKGKRWQGRSFRHNFKGLEHHPSVRIVEGSSKHRYLMPLNNEIKQKVSALSMPYPKRVESDTIDTSSFQDEKGGETPTSTLHNNLRPVLT